LLKYCFSGGLYPCSNIHEAAFCMEAESLSDTNPNRQLLPPGSRAFAG
jgi:hypothetical protein